jgi:hypothetical protein
LEKAGILLPELGDFRLERIKLEKAGTVLLWTSSAADASKNKVLEDFLK